MRTLAACRDMSAMTASHIFHSADGGGLVTQWAAQDQRSLSEENFNNIVPILGGFHVLMLIMEVILQSLEGSGYHSVSHVPFARHG